MKDSQLIKKIKELRQIKPNRDWVSLTKREILGEKKDKQIINWLFTPIRRPTFVIRTVMVAVLILAGSLFYLYYLNSQTPQISFSNLNFFQKQQENENLIASLQELETSLNKITFSLNNLKNLKDKDPKQALAVTEVVRVTANNGQNSLKEMKEKTSSKKVLAALTEMEDSFQELGETSSNLQTEIIESLFQDLSQRTLSEDDQNRLQKAKDYYNEGNIEQAMIFLMRIGQK